MNAKPDCLRLEPLLGAALDGELAAGEQALVEAHLAGCAACRATLAELRALAAAAGRGGFAPPAPVPAAEWAAVWERLRDRCRTVEERHALLERRRRRTFLAGTVAATAAAAALLLALALPLFRGTTAGDGVGITPVPLEAAVERPGRGAPREYAERVEIRTGYGYEAMTVYLHDEPSPLVIFMRSPTAEN